MWKVLGADTILISAGDTWKERLVELSKRKKDREKFLKILDKGQVRYVFDTSRETHVFIIELPSEFGPEEIRFMGSFITKIQKAAKQPQIELEGEPQKSAVIITSEEPEDDYEARKRRRAEEKEE